MDGCRCDELCFLCAAVEVRLMGRRKVGRTPTGREQAKLYWSARAGCPAGEIHIVVSEALTADAHFCTKAWLSVLAKEQVLGTSKDRAAEFVETLEFMLSERLKSKRLAEHEKAMAVRRTKPYK